MCSSDLHAGQAARRFLVIADRSQTQAAVAALAGAGVPSAEVDARLLWEHAADAAQFAEWISRRAAREPLQHLIGIAWFRHLELAVGPGVFIPRPETELLAQVAIDELVARGGGVAVDMCSGSGAVAIAVATEAANSVVHAVELSDAAWPYLRRNAAIAGDRLTVHLGDATDSLLLADLDGAVHVVTANPPYIPDSMVPREPEVRDHDPALALYGGPDGLDVARGIVARAAALLAPGGVLVMEHADVQGESVRDLFDHAWVEVVDHQDYNGLPRFVTARRMGS